MGLYLISYDLRKVRNYQRLYDVLIKWKAAKLLESLWLAKPTGPAPTICGLLRTTVDSDDGLVVIELQASSDWATIKALLPGTR